MVADSGGVKIAFSWFLKVLEVNCQGNAVLLDSPLSSIFLTRLLVATLAEVVLIYQPATLDDVFSQPFYTIPGIDKVSTAQ